LTRTYAIVPIRDFGNAKRRLGRTLDKAQRAALALALLSHIIRALEGTNRIVETIVVASDEKESREALSSFQRIRIVQETSFHGGVNSAVIDGLAVLAPESEDPDILILPSDLPLLSTEAVERALRLLDDHDLAINPSLRKDGTNMLAFHYSKRIPLWYDHNSYQNHVREAMSKNLLFVETNWEEFSFDIDDEADLDAVTKKFGAKSLVSFLSLL
jgi:2-phospho-L-lactate/phosphoenolpyruvate guanylyltransferase